VVVESAGIVSPPRTGCSVWWDVRPSLSGDGYWAGARCTINGEKTMLYRITFKKIEEHFPFDGSKYRTETIEKEVFELIHERNFEQLRELCRTMEKQNYD
jgi:hypothetical protein